MKSSRHALVKLFISMLAVFSLTACSGIKLISDYDQEMDQGVTNVQRKVEAILTKIEKAANKPNTTYDTKDYSAIKEDLDVLITRAGSVDRNELTIKQLHVLGYALLESPPIAPDDLKLKQPPKEVSLEGRNKQPDSLTSEDIRDLRDILRTNFRAVLKLELAKKRGAAATTDSK